MDDLAMIEASMEEARRWSERGPAHRDAARASADAALMELVLYLAEQLDDPSELATVRRIVEAYNAL